MVVDGGKLESQRYWCLEFSWWEKASHICLNHIKTFDLLIITHEHIAINLVDEDFVNDIRFDLRGLLDKITKAHACTLIVWLMRINDID